MLVPGEKFAIRVLVAFETAAYELSILH